MKAKAVHVVQTVGLLSVVALSAASAAVLIGPDRSVVGLAIAWFDPVFAAILSLALAILIPSFLGTQLERIHAATLPLVYVALVVMVRALAQEDPTSVIEPREIPRTDRIWSSPGFLAAVAVAQAITLMTLKARFDRRTASSDP